MHTIFTMHNAHHVPVVLLAIVMKLTAPTLECKGINIHDTPRIYHVNHFMSHMLYDIYLILSIFL